MTSRFAAFSIAPLLVGLVGSLTIFSAACGSSGDDSAAQNTGDSGSSDSSASGDGAPNPGDGGLLPDGATYPAHVRPAGTFNLGMNVPGLNYYNNAAIYAALAMAIS